MNKEEVKRIGGNGLPWGVGFFILSFLIGRYLFELTTENDIVISFIMGIGALLANGVVYTRFCKPLRDLKEIWLEIDKAETLLLSCPANHMIDENLVSGKLFLTNKKLLFKAHNDYEIFPEILIVDLADIKPGNFYGSPWNAGGEFLLNTTDDNSLMFEVDELKLWKQAF